MVKLFVINNLIVYNGKTDKVIGTLQKKSNIFISFALKSPLYEQNVKNKLQTNSQFSLKFCLKYNCQISDIYCEKKLNKSCQQESVFLRVFSSGDPFGLAAFRTLGMARRSRKLVKEHFSVGNFYSTFCRS